MRRGVREWLTDPRLLGAYAGVMTVALVVLSLKHFSPGAKHGEYDEITVQRINLVEPDGTLRLVIADSARFPGIVVRGKEYRHPGRDRDRKNLGIAGMIFLDAEGSESGGLTFGGRKQPDGSVARHGSLSFDHYEQDEATRLSGGENGGDRFAGILFKDQPDWPSEELIKLLAQAPDENGEQIYAEWFATHPDNHIGRAYLGRKPDRSSALELKDEQGRDRIVIKVTADGNAALQLLNENGEVVDQWPRPPPR
jgi:hypothetical protein